MCTKTIFFSRNRQIKLFFNKADALNSKNFNTNLREFVQFMVKKIVCKADSLITLYWIICNLEFCPHDGDYQFFNYNLWCSPDGA